WEMGSVGLDRLLARLADRLPPGGRVGRIVLLSGDVHHSFASRMVYQATTPYESTGPNPATVVFAQLVSSALKNQSDNTLGLHRVGYRYGPWKGPFHTAWLIPPHTPEYYAGWNTAQRGKVS